MELQISHSVCAEVPAQSILQGETSSSRENITATMRVERRKNYRGRGMPKPHPSVCGDTTEDFRVTLHGVSKREEYAKGVFIEADNQMFARRRRAALGNHTVFAFGIPLSMGKERCLYHPVRQLVAPCRRIRYPSHFVRKEFSLFGPEPPAADPRTAAPRR